MIKRYLLKPTKMWELYVAGVVAALVAFVVGFELQRTLLRFPIEENWMVVGEQAVLTDPLGINLYWTVNSWKLDKPMDPLIWRHSD